MARVLRTLLRESRFVDEVSLKEELRRRCARLRIRGVGPRGYNDLVDRAMVLVGSNVALVLPPAPAPSRRVAAPAIDERRTASRLEAATVLGQLRDRLGPCGPRAFPRATA